MAPENSPMSALEALDLYFLDNRARMYEIASFLDRIERYENSSEAKDDYRYKSFIKALRTILESSSERTKKAQLIFSDMSEGPLETVTDPKAYGAWKGAVDEAH